MPGLLLDSNIWLAATFPHNEFHPAAVQLLAGVTVTNPALFCRATEQSFLRLATSPRILAHYRHTGMTNRTALAVLELFLCRPSIRMSEEPAGTVALWHRLATRETASPKVWMDAYLAAFAIAGNYEIVTLDRDFKTYQPHGLRLRLLG